MSSKKNEKPLKELVNQMLRAYGLGPKLDEMSLVKSWEKVVGSMIAKHTADIFLKRESYTLN
jgi:predicted nucleic acid-binding Zn ribbon protein